MGVQALISEMARGARKAAPTRSCRCRQSSIGMASADVLEEFLHPIEFAFGARSIKSIIEVVGNPFQFQLEDDAMKKRQLLGIHLINPLVQLRPELLWFNVGQTHDLNIREQSNSASEIKPRDLSCYGLFERGQFGAVEF